LNINNTIATLVLLQIQLRNSYRDDTSADESLETEEGIEVLEEEQDDAYSPIMFAVYQAAFIFVLLIPIVTLYWILKHRAKLETDVYKQ